MKSSPIRCLLGLFVTTAISNAAVQLASPFGEHMVLQQGRRVPVWGTASAGEKVSVEFASHAKNTIAGHDGKWRVDLDPLPVSAVGRIFTVTGSATGSPIKIGDVLVGEVWICGGQSNMERQLGPRPPQKPIVNWEQEVAAANHPLIRQFYVTQQLSPAPKSTLEGKWTVCSPATAVDFTAVGYFFARDLQKALNVPVGIIHSSWGGTPAEAWTSRGGLSDFPEFKKSFAQLDRAAIDPVGAKRDYLAQLEQWFRKNDPGSGDHPWNGDDIDTSGWERMNLPAYWEDTGHPGFDGVVWYRKPFDLVDGWSGSDLELRLSAIDDIDTTWVNGVQVGGTSGWDTPRVYHVPGSLLHPKGNLIAVRVLDTGGNGGIWNTDLPFEMIPTKGKGSALSLTGPWRVRFSTSLTNDFKDRPPIDATQGPGVPTVLYNAMIAPLEPYAIRGVTFYQGEANADRAHQYRTLFPALIADWRKQWGEGDFPFLFVQIAPFNEMPPEIREAQLLAWQATKDTAMVVTIDCGDADNIHPAHKQPVGARLALAAEALAYGQHVEYSGPVFEKMKAKSNRVILDFTHVGGGLVAKEGPLAGFTTAGSDGVFHPASAEIKKDTVVVSSPTVNHPTAVRYAWANVAAGNLFNRAGLPASPFETDIKP